MKTIVWSFLVAAACLTGSSGEFLMGGHLDNKRSSGLIDFDVDLDAEESTVGLPAVTTDEEGTPRFNIPFQFAFNGGKPFSLEKDPITGKIDFEKTPVKPLNYSETFKAEDSEETDRRVIKDSEKKSQGKDSVDVAPNEINPYTPNFHDFLNLPVHYSSDKYAGDKYPLISSSYANTKVQSGSNSYNTYNHRPYHEDLSSKTTFYYPTRKPYVKPTTTTTTTTTMMPTTTTTTTTTMKSTTTTTTTPRPTTTTAATTKVSTLSTRTIPTMKTTTTTTKPSTKIATKPPVVTTWKPATTTTTTTTMKPSMEDYDDALPIEKLQESSFNPGNRYGSNNVLPPRGDIPPTSPANNEEYGGYFEYDSHDEDNEGQDYPSIQQGIRTQGPSGTTTTVSTTTVQVPSAAGIVRNPPKTTMTTSATTILDETSQPVDRMDPVGSQNSNQPPMFSFASNNRPESSMQPTSAMNSANPAAHPFYTMNSAPMRPSSSMNPPPSTVNSGQSIRPPMVNPLPPTRPPPQTLLHPPPIKSPPTIHASSVKSPGSLRPQVHHQTNGAPTNPLQFHALPQRPVTSMPLDSGHREPPTYENTLDIHGSTILGNGVVKHGGYYPGQVGDQRPAGIGHGVLVESTSNIVIPPDQDTVSFVLGNRQNVEGGYYVPGTAIGENPYGGPTGVDGSFQSVFHTAPSSSDRVNFNPQANAQGSVALPSVSVDSGYNFAPQQWPQPTAAPAKPGNEGEPPKTTITFVQENPPTKQDTQQEDNSGYVVFPGSSHDENHRQVEEHIVIINEADGTIREVTPTTTAKPRIDGPQGNEENLPQLAENLTPPAERPRPVQPYYHQYAHNAGARPQRPPSRTKPDPAGLKRRPYPSDVKLPNILPQFRPNAKTSHGHRGPETIGTIPASQSFPTRVRQPVSPHQPPRRPLPPVPPYLQRLNPPPPPIHAIRMAASSSAKLETILPPHNTEPTVKRYRLPSISAKSRGEDEDRVSQLGRVPPQKQKLRVEEDERAERFAEEPSQVPPRPPMFPQRRTADPPRVATLQMIQQHGEFDEHHLAKDDSSSRDDGLEEDERSDGRKDELSDSMEDSPVYVVYPVNTAVNIHSEDPPEEDESVVVGTRGPHRPLPPDTLPQDDEEEEEETRNPEESMIHNVYNNRPVASDFPYPLERPGASLFAGPMRETPLLVPSDQRRRQDTLNTDEDDQEDKVDRDSSVNVIPYLQDFVPFPAKKQEGPISATLHRSPSAISSTPIAYVYTPTVRPSHRVDEKHEDVQSYEGNERKPVLLPSQQPSSSSSSAPSPQNFMAPFVASVNAEEPVKNGWSVVMVEPASKSNKQPEETEEGVSSDETQTERSDFDLENFKPQLFGGFKPIYEFPMDDDVRPIRRENSEEHESTKNKPDAA